MFEGEEIQVLMTGKLPKAVLGRQIVAAVSQYAVERRMQFHQATRIHDESVAYRLGATARDRCTCFTVQATDEEMRINPTQKYTQFLVVFYSSPYGSDDGDFVTLERVEKSMKEIRDALCELLS